MKLLESHIAKTCTDCLVLDDWRPIKMEPISRREWGKGTGEKGMADYLYIRYPEPQEWGESWPHLKMLTPIRVKAMVMWIEWKRLRGKAKLHQKAWHDQERARGALTLIAGEDFPATPEGFFAHSAASGLMRRNMTMQDGRITVTR